MENKKEIKIFNNSFTNHQIEYFIIHNETYDDIYVWDIYIDPDDGKTFASLLVTFCKMAIDNKIKYIKLTVSNDEYNSHKHYFREFEATKIDDVCYDLIAESSKFAEAMLISYGCFDCEDKTDKKN